MNRLVTTIVFITLSAQALVAQNNVITWSALDMGFATPASPTTELRSIAGQVIVGTTASAATRADAGFLVGPTFGQSVSGAVIVYSRSGTSGGTIWMRSVDGSVDSQITSGSWPRMSHNGRYIVFHKGSGIPNRLDMNLYDRQTGQDTLLFQNIGDYINTYDWLEDDDHIVFDYSCSMRMMNRDGTGVTTLFQVDCYDDAPVVQPGSRALAHHNAFQGIMLTDSLGVNRHHIPNTAGGDYWPAWSPDGQWISFGVANDTVRNYSKIHPDGTGLTALTAFSGSQSAFLYGGAWTADGSKIIVPGRINGVWGIYAIATDGSGGVALIPTTPGDPIDFVGTVTGNIDLTLTGVHERDGHLPAHTGLDQNFPNPFNPSTTITFQLVRYGSVTIRVYDLLGREVKTLVNGNLEPGYHEVVFDATGLASGVYFYRLNAGNSSMVKKLLLLR
jgi:hypothetical protein